MDTLPFDFSANAANVVCVSIGVNLLLPASPRIFRWILEQVDTDPASIAKRHFTGNDAVRRYLKTEAGERRHARLAYRASAIDVQKDELLHASSFGWFFLDVVFVIAGIAVLWLNLVAYGWVAQFSVALFAPALLSTTWPIVSCTYKRFLLWKEITAIRLCAWWSDGTRKKERKDLTQRQNDFISKMLHCLGGEAPVQAVAPNGGGKPQQCAKGGAGGRQPDSRNARPAPGKPQPDGQARGGRGRPKGR